MVEGGDQFDRLRQQHAVSEHVARHVADADDGEGLGLDVLAHLAEVTLDRLPGAAGGDAHDLVVVADRSARGEGVIQPEAVVGRDAVRDVGEGRRALVGGHDQIGIVAFKPDHAGRMGNGTRLVDVVGDVQQAGQEGLVGADGLGLLGVAIAAGAHDGRQTFREEPALGPDRHDDGVLDLLGLHQTQNLGAEVVAAVRPAQATTGDRAEAQVNALDMRCPDEDFAERLGQGQVGQFARGDLDRDVRLVPAVGPGLVVVGALDRLDQQSHPAQGAVMIEALHVLEQGVDLLDQFCDRGLAAGGVAAGGRIEFRREQGQQGARHGRIVAQRLFLNRLAGIETGLLAIAGESPHQGRLAPVDAQLQHQPVEPVAFGATRPDRREGRLERALHIGELKVAAARVLHQELMNVDFRLARRTQGVAPFLERLETHVGEDRQHVRQRHRRPPPIQFEAEIQRAFALDAEGAHRHRIATVVQAAVVQRIDRLEVAHGLGGVIAVTITGPEGLGPTGTERPNGHVVDIGVAQGALEPVDPAAPGLGDLDVQRRLIRARMIARRHADDVVDADQGLVRQLRVPG